MQLSQSQDEAGVEKWEGKGRREELEWVGDEGKVRGEETGDE